jgi:hypothetical protein
MQVLQTINQRRLAKLSANRIAELEERHVMEEHELAVLCQREAATNGELVGRQSGMANIYIRDIVILRDVDISF